MHPHADGAQLVYPRFGEPFVLLLAKPGDDITPQDCTAFYFDGTFGAAIRPNVWHQPAFPVHKSITLRNKQVRIRAWVCVCVHAHSVSGTGRPSYSDVHAYVPISACLR